MSKVGLVNVWKKSSINKKLCIFLLHSSKSEKKGYTFWLVSKYNGPKVLSSGSLGTSGRHAWTRQNNLTLALMQKKKKKKIAESKTLSGFNWTK